MCGLLAILGSNVKDFDRKSISLALETIAHRGPDDGSHRYWSDSYFGHRRLSIIDLSNQGLQPMITNDDRYSIIFNGMIYNYKELRRELQGLGCSFLTDTDTEVILLGYSIFGKDISCKLRGIWSFIIRDEQEKTVYISRDHFGVKPLNYYQKNNSLIFASEIKTIQSLVHSKITMNKDNVFRYLARGWMDDSGQSMFNEVRQFPPGHHVVINLAHTNEGFCPEAFWELKPDFSENVSINELKSELVNSVALQLQSDVPVALALSSGVDSNTLAGIIGSLGMASQVETFTLETPMIAPEIAHETLARYKFKNTIVRTNETDLRLAFREAIEHNDEPINGANSVYQMILRKAASSSGNKVLLSGDGADELFGGYQRSYFAYLSALYDMNEEKSFERAVADGQVFLGKTASEIYEEWQMSHICYKTQKFHQHNEVSYGLLGTEFASMHSKIFAEEQRFYYANMDGAAFFDNLASLLRKRYLPLILRTEDRISSAFAIETRVPFLDHKLAELLWRFDYKKFMENGLNKQLLRAAASEFIPKSVSQMRAKIRKPGSNVDAGILNSSAKKAFEEDMKSNDFHRSFFWMRVYILQIWRSVNLDRKIQIMV